MASLDLLPLRDRGGLVQVRVEGSRLASGNPGQVGWLFLAWAIGAAIGAATGARVGDLAAFYTATWVGNLLALGACGALTRRPRGLTLLAPALMLGLAWLPLQTLQALFARSALDALQPAVYSVALMLAMTLLIPGRFSLLALLALVGWATLVANCGLLLHGLAAFPGQWLAANLAFLAWTLVLAVPVAFLNRRLALLAPAPALPTPVSDGPVSEGLRDAAEILATRGARAAELARNFVLPYADARGWAYARMSRDVPRGVAQKTARRVIEKVGQLPPALEAYCLPGNPMRDLARALRAEIEAFLAVATVVARSGFQDEERLALQLSLADDRTGDREEALQDFLRGRSRKSL